MSGCPTCKRELYADGNCSGCAYPASLCRCLTPDQVKRAASTTNRGRKVSGAKKPSSNGRTWPTDRLPIEKRVGTVIDHRFATPIFGRGKMANTRQGTIDKRQRVYQSGGELKNFVYHRLDVVSIPMDVWERLQSGVDTIEMICHVTNRCMRIRLTDARAHGYVYEAGIGQRWGVPVAEWTVEQGEPPPLVGGPLDPPRAPQPDPQPKLL